MPLEHYYSLYPDINKIDKRLNESYEIDRKIMEIDFNICEQHTLLEKMKEFLLSRPK